MPTLVLPPRFTDDSNLLWRTAIELGWNVERLRSLRVQPGSIPEPVLYADGLTASAVAEPLGLELVEPPLDFLASLPERFRKRPVEFTSMGNVRGPAARRWPLFVKPAGDKAFKAQVYGASGELPDAVLDEEPVLVSPPVRFREELRFFVLDREIVAGSPYVVDGGLAVDEHGEWTRGLDVMGEARSFAQEVVRDEDVRVVPAFVLDVGRIEGLGWAVVEANPAYASGICGCDPVEVLRVLRRTSAYPVCQRGVRQLPLRKS